MMTTAGWVFNDGNVSTNFKGHGKAALNFSNYKNTGTTNVYLNNIWIATSNASEFSNLVEFYYKPNDTLILVEISSIEQINSMQLTCGGKDIIAL